MLIFSLTLIFTSCALQKNNLKKDTLKVIYYGDLYDIQNIGKLKFYTKYSLQDLVHIKQDSEATYIKAYYTPIGNLLKAEKFEGDKRLPSKIYWINKNNINYKTRYYKNNTYVDCNLTYAKDDNFRIKTTICNDGMKEVLTTKINRVFVSDFKYNKSGNIIKKEISTKKGIEIWKNGKLIEITNEEI